MVNQAWQNWWQYREIWVHALSPKEWSSTPRPSLCAKETGVFRASSMEQFQRKFLDPPCLNHSMDGRRSFSDFDNSSPSGAAPDVTSFRLDKSYCSTSGLLDKNSTVEGTRAAWETWEITKLYIFNLAWLLPLSRYKTVATEQHAILRRLDTPSFSTRGVQSCFC